jgi:uncharacterized membrane protein YhhN
MQGFMKLGKNQFLGYLYLLLLLTDVCALIAGENAIHTWVKPLLMPTLLGFLWGVIPPQTKYYWLPVALGLTTAWLGDVFLLFESYSPLFFILGLSAFLITHVFYIIFFKKLIQPYPDWWARHFYKWIAVLSFAVLLAIGLWPYLGALKIPVLLYAMVISTMVIGSLRVQHGLPRNIWVWMALGAFLFFISDSILALNKFMSPAKFGGASVMLTYGLAQFFIVLGTIRFCEAIADEAPRPVE